MNKKNTIVQVKDKHPPIRSNNISTQNQIINMLRRIILSAVPSMFFLFAAAQNVGIGTNSPAAKLEVNGSLIATAAYKSRSINPATGTNFIGGSIVYMTGSDSVKRFYDPAGNSGNYSSDAKGDAIIALSGSHLKITIEQIGLGAGDSLIIYDGSSDLTDPILYRAGNNISGSNISITTSNGIGRIKLKTNGDPSVGSGFSILIRRYYLDESLQDPAGVGGSGLVFYPKKKSFKMGQFRQDVIGNNAIAFGKLTAATGDASSAFGNLTEASGLNSVAFGFDNQASGDYSFTSGLFSSASGFSSMAMGHFVAAGGNYSSAFGWRCTAVGQNSMAMGAGIHNKSYAALVIGRYNDTGIGTPTFWQTSDKAFVIGDGESDSERSDCFFIQKSGSVWTQGTIAQSSDARLKKNITQLTGVLPKLLNLSGYNYEWKDSLRRPGLQAGLIAQEVQQQIPELVTDDSQGKLAVNYMGMVPYLLEGLKEQQQKINAQQEKIDRLEQELLDIQSMLLRMEKAEAKK